MKLLTIPYEQFDEAYKTDVSKYVERTYQGISYLSWPFAIRFLRKHYPALHVDFDLDVDGSVLHLVNGGFAYVRPFLTDGDARTPSLVFPVMDRKHNAAANPDARAVSDACQRATVKAIATFTGIGLSLYAKEDIEQHMDDNLDMSPALRRQDSPVQRMQQVAESQRSPSASYIEKLEPHIAKFEGVVNEYLITKRGLLKEGQTWRDLPVDLLKKAANEPELILSKVR